MCTRFFCKGKSKGAYNINKSGSVPENKPVKIPIQRPTLSDLMNRDQTGKETDNSQVPQKVNGSVITTETVHDHHSKAILPPDPPPTGDDNQDEEIYATREEIKPTIPEEQKTVPDIRIEEDVTIEIKLSVDTAEISSENIERPVSPELPAKIEIEEERRPGVIPLPVNFDETSVGEIVHHPKTAEDEALIRGAIERNDFLNKILKGDLLTELISTMYSQEIRENETVIKEGTKGSHMYVCANGAFEVSVKGKGVVNTFDDVRVFGEIAILYNAKRNATIRALRQGRVWILDRSVFQKLMVRFNIKEQDELLSFLQSVPKLNKVGTKALQVVVNLLKVKYYTPGSVIIRQGEKGDKFYIIRAGTVTITKEGEGVVANFGRGQYFGERALLKEDVRQATVIADTPGGVECLTLKRQHFIDHFGELGEDGIVPEPIVKRDDDQAIQEHEDIDLKDLNVVTTLGVGGFGRVELVQHNKVKNLIFALKYLKKIDMLEQNQQEHVHNERNIQQSCRSRFIIRLYRSYKDNKYIYFLMEPCLGGDLWTLLQRQKTRRFEEKEARFIAACVLEAFTYLHERDIVYRDLKPENILIDSQGYVKLTDFGFAKKLGSRGRTFTFAGTPEYVAPEIILSKGHDKAVDYWAFGIFIFELLTGRTPFRTNDNSHMRTYNKILTGIDNVDFPSYVSSRGRHIVERLCRAIPTERLGCQRKGVKEIKEHRWFLGFQWVELNEGKLPGPFKPKLRTKTDTRYFEAFKKDTDVPPDETSGWDTNF